MHPLVGVSLPFKLCSFVDRGENPDGYLERLTDECQLAAQTANAKHIAVEVCASAPSSRPPPFQSPRPLGARSIGTKKG